MHECTKDWQIQMEIFLKIVSGMVSCNKIKMELMEGMIGNMHVDDS